MTIEETLEKLAEALERQTDAIEASTTAIVAAIREDDERILSSLDGLTEELAQFRHRVTGL